MKVASSASIATTVSTSFRSQASAYSSTISLQLLVAERAQRLLLALLGQLLLDRRAGALERAVDRGDAGVERLAGLLRRESEHLAQDQDGALVGGEQLEGRDERELDRLALLVARVGRGVAVLDAEGLVGVGLDPDRLDHRLADAAVRVGRRAVVDRQDALRAPLDRVQAGVGGDPVEPGAQRAPPLELRQRPARRAAAPPGARPRRRAPSRACGSSGRGARSGGARPAAGRRPRLPLRAASSSSRSWTVVSGSCSLLGRVKRSAAREPMSFRSVNGHTGRDESAPAPIPSSTWSSTRGICAARSRSTRSSAAGARSGSTPGPGPTWRSAWAAASAAGWSSARPSQPLWLPYVEVPDIGATTERARGARRRRSCSIRARARPAGAASSPRPPAARSPSGSRSDEVAPRRIGSRFVSPLTSHRRSGEGRSRVCFTVALEIRKRRIRLPAGTGEPTFLGRNHSGGGAGSFSASPAANPVGRRRRKTCPQAGLHKCAGWRLPAILLITLVGVAPANAQTGGSAAPGAPAAPAATAPAPPGAHAKLTKRGVAIAPAGAPAAVQAAINAGNSIRKLPYRWGGGHATFTDTGYDCSGSVSFVLNAAGLLPSPMTSGGLMQWGLPGRGSWVTVYANRRHVYAVIAGLRWDTSSIGERLRRGSGPRWRATMRKPRGYAIRYAPGL